MTGFILLVAVVLIMCVFSDRLSGKIGVPALLIFIGVGIFFGCDGPIKIPFENYEFASYVCDTALIVIMFTGGFSMNWKSAKPVIVKAGLLSTLGVAVTALVTCLFCHFVLQFGFAESLLLGSVVSSTDAASVFSVLRSKKLNLKNGLAPLLEAESGSNDPFSYMLTVISLSLLTNKTETPIPLLILGQLAFGIIFGGLVGILGAFVSKRYKAQTEGFECILFLAFALFAYGLSSMLGGNGYLSVYIAGVIIGNAKTPKNEYKGRSPIKKLLNNAMGITLNNSGKGIAPPEAVVFLNGVTGICQIAVFFLLGLLSTPSQFGESILLAVPIYLCLTLVSRPAAVAIFGGKSPLPDRLFVSLAGLRGASSIVFAILAIVSGAPTEHNIFNIVFCICLLSMLVQGTLLPAAAKKLNLIDDESDVLKTFNDYREDDLMTMMRMFIPENHSWQGKKLSEITLPTGSLAVMIRRGKETLIPRGDTVIEANDSVILSVPPYKSDRIDKSLKLREIPINSHHIWRNSQIRELKLPKRLLIVMIKRGEESIIPSGATTILKGDIVVVTDTETVES
ncbi:MAG: potassium/proton antiporter [Lachnospiraceae bacterium]|nr:potassium/proton antiporter [Ruminococcus sp.]MCM1276120.1 potassium/proton antiporter [Lachnospiraceae bacterium]